MKNIFLANLLVLLLWGCKPKTGELVGYVSGPAYRIAYNVSMDSTGRNYDIWTMNPDGSDKRNITNHPDVAWTYYAWQDRLFFISDRDTCYRCYFLWETDCYGSTPRRVSDLRLEDSWMGSRNAGKELIVSGRTEKARFQLFLLDTWSGQHHQITFDTSALYRDPTFSPDGQQIVYAYKANRRDRNTNEELWIMDADGGNKRQLTHYPQDDPLRTDFGYKAGPPRWHPEGEFISYHSQQQGKGHLFAITPDGKKQWKLLKQPLDEGWHDWSPNGDMLAVDLCDTAASQYHIAVARKGSKRPKIISDTRFKYQHAPVILRFPTPK